MQTLLFSGRVAEFRVLEPEAVSCEFSLQDRCLRNINTLFSTRTAWRRRPGELRLASISTGDFFASSALLSTCYCALALGGKAW